MWPRSTTTHACLGKVCAEKSAICDCPEQNKAIVIVSQPRQISNHAMFVPEIHPDKCTGCGLCVHSCPTDKPSINIVDPDAFLGKIGDHYRLGWKEKLDARAVPDAPMTSKDGSRFLREAWTS